MSKRQLDDLTQALKVARRERDEALSELKRIQAVKMPRAVEAATVEALKEDLAEAETHIREAVETLKAEANSLDDLKVQEGYHRAAELLREAAERLNG